MGTLSDVTRRRIAAALLVVIVILAIAAAEDLGPFDDPPTEAERAAAAVEDLFAAAGEGDFKAFCKLLTEQEQAIVEINGARLAGEKDLKGCDEILEEQIGDRLKGSSIEVKSVTVSGVQARAEANFKLGGKRGHTPRTILLEQVEGEWLISDPG